MKLSEILRNKSIDCDNEMLDMAADLAEQLETELEEKEQGILVWMKLYWEWLDRASKAEAENKVIRKAFSEHPCPFSDCPYHAVLDALKESE